MEKIKLTVEGKRELEERLKELRNDLIPAVVQRIKRRCAYRKFFRRDTGYACY